MKLILKVFFSLLASFCVIAPLSELLGYGIDLYSIIIMLLLVHIVINILLYDIRVLKWFLIAVGSALSLTFLIMLIFDGGISIPKPIADYFEKLFLSVVFAEYITTDMFMPTMLLIIFGISLLVYILIQKLQAYMSLFAVVFGYFGFLTVSPYGFDMIYFYIFFFVAIMMYFERYYEQKLPEDSPNRGFVAIIPSLVIFAVLLTSASALTSALKPDPVSFVDNISARIMSIRFGRGPSSENTIVRYDTETAFSQGFSASDNTTVMVVDSPTNLHLKSRTYDFYDGLNWQSSVNIEEYKVEIIPGMNHISLETLENILGYYYLKNGSIPEIQTMNEETFVTFATGVFNMVEMDVTYRNIRTKAIFAPSNTYYVDHTPAQARLELDMYDGIIASGTDLTRDFRYILRTFVPPIEDPDFVNLLRTADENSPINSIFTRPGLDAYLQIPDTVPDRVRELALSITEEYSNEYDKARAIERYLSLNHTYSLDVPPIPSNADFVDHFLFEETTGFCTYYASAMTIMLRSIGIPARYSRGYVMPKKTPIDELLDGFSDFIGIDEYTNPTLYTIIERYAHAWPEAYISGYGWLSFEPTTVYYSSYLPYEPTGDYYTPLEPRDPVAPIDPSVSDSNLILYMQLILFVMLLCLLISPFAYRAFKRYKYSKLDNRQKVLITFKKIIYVLKLADHNILPYETARIFAVKIDKKLYLGDRAFERIIRIFEEAKYSTHKINIFDLNIVENYFSSTKKEIINWTNFLRSTAYYLTGRL